MIFGLMVARNEQSRYLEENLKRLSSQVDKIIFTDDCSTDQTPEIARQYAEVYQTSEVLFTKHEGQLRYEAWENLSKHAKPGDWVVAIDADEMLFTMDNSSIEDTLNSSPFDVVNVRRYEMWNEKEYRVDKMWAPHNTFRIFRFAKDGVYKDKRLACGSEPTYVENWVRNRNYWFVNPFVMQHLGYARDEDKQAKYDRYMDLDKGEFHNLVHLQSILDPDPVLIPWGIFADKKVELV
jgi:glycosyltransferase involved in cell wall biosynthesis